MIDTRQADGNTTYVYNTVYSSDFEGKKSPQSSAVIIS